MASIDITTQSGAVGNGDLQLQNGAPMDGTLRLVTDALNTASPLLLSTTGVQITSPLRITTSDASGFYLDAEDSATNNRFSIKRDPSSQQVTLDFASNPAGSTTAVGAIRTFRDGVNLSEAMTFIEDGSIGVGTTAPVGLFDLFKSAAATRLAIRGDAGQNRLISYRTGALQRFGLYVNNTAESGANAGSNFAIRAYNDAGTFLSTPLFIERSSGNVGIGTTAPTHKLQVEQTAVGSTAAYILNTTTAGSGQAGYGLIVESEASAVTSYNAIFRDLAQSQNYLVIKTETGQDGHVGINTYDPAVHLDVNGQIRANSGILFGTDTAAANALDDYEEGNFTPTIIGSTTAGTATYTTQVGKYTKIGRQVSVQIDLGYNSGTGTGNLGVAGLPFTENQSTNPAVTIGYLDGITLTASNYAVAYIASLSTRIDIVQVPVGGGALTSVAYDDAGRIILNVTYVA